MLSYYAIESMALPTTCALVAILLKILRPQTVSSDAISHSPLHVVYLLILLEAMLNSLSISYSYTGRSLSV